MFTSVLESKIFHFTNSVNKSLNEKNWYAALPLSLTLPDICSRIEKPKVYSSTRYPEWFDQYVSPFYIQEVGMNKEEEVYLSGNDAYALRCSFMHQGETNIELQKAQRVLNDFIFVTLQENFHFHNDRISYKENEYSLQLQVDKFCLDIIEGVTAWLKENKENTLFNERAEKMIGIKKIF